MVGLRLVNPVIMQSALSSSPSLWAVPGDRAPSNGCYLCSLF